MSKQIDIPLDNIISNILGLYLFIIIRANITIKARILIFISQGNIIILILRSIGV